MALYCGVFVLFCAVDHGWASFCDLARDDQGRCLEGLCGRIGYVSPLKAELWGIKRGLKLAKDRGWKKAILETDCEMAMELIETGEIENHPEKIIIEDCCILVQENEAEMTHLLRVKQMCRPSVQDGVKSMKLWSCSNKT